MLRDNGPKIFQVETSINTAAFPDTFGFLSKREWEWTAKDRALYLATEKSLKRMPNRAKRRRVGHHDFR